MAIRHFIVDWNGTLCEMIGDSVIMRRILLAVLRDALARAAHGRPPGVVDVARFLRGNVAFRRAKRRYDAGEATLPELYDPINYHVLRGAPVAVIEGVLDAYAKAHAGCIDDRMVAGLTTARELGATMTVFSAAYDAGVRSILERAGLLGAIDDVVANVLEADGDRALGMTARNYDGKAGDFYRVFIEERGWLAEEMIYAGDSDVDEPVAELLPRGHFIVPFLATPAFRVHMVETHGAFAPATAEELSAHLRSL